MAFIPKECTLEQYEEEIYSGNNLEHRLVIKSGDEILGSEEDGYASNFTSSLTLKRYLISEVYKTFNLNNLVTKEVQLTTNDYKLPNIEMPITISIDTYIESVQNWVKVPLGVFYVQEINETDNGVNYYTLKDNSIKLDFNYDARQLIENSTKVDEQGNKYVTKLEILLDICNKAGVTYKGALDFKGNNDKVAIYDNTISARVYIMYILEQAGLIGTIDRDGNLISIDLSGELAIRVLDANVLEKFKVGLEYKISRVRYESGVILFEKGLETNDTLFIDSSNPYITNQEQIDYIYNKYKDFTIYSFSTGRCYGNPTIDEYDVIELTYEDSTYKTLAQHTFQFTGVFTNIYDTQIELNEKQEDVSQKSEATYKKGIKTEIDNVNATLSLKAYKDEIVNEINLSPEEILLKGNRFVLESDNAKIDKEGNAEFLGAKLRGGDLELEDDGTGNNASVKIEKKTHYKSQIEIDDNLNEQYIYLDEYTSKDMFTYENISNLIDSYGGIIHMLQSDNGYCIDLLNVVDGQMFTCQIRLINADGEVVEPLFVLLEDNTISVNNESYQLPSDFGNVTNIDERMMLYFKLWKDNIKIHTTSYSSTGIEADILSDYDYTQDDLDRCQQIGLGNITPTDEDYLKLDVNRDGKINALDLLKIGKVITANITSTKPGKFKIDTSGVENNVIMKDGDGNTIFNLSMIGGIQYKGHNLDSPVHEIYNGIYAPRYPLSSHTLALDEKISEQMNGIIIVWCPYDSSKGKAYNTILETQIILKYNVPIDGTYTRAYKMMAWTGFNKIGFKEIVVYDDKIVGIDTNQSTGTKNGITYDNTLAIIGHIYGF